MRPTWRQGDRGRHPDRIERGRGAGLQLQPGAVPVGRLRRRDARPDPGRHRLGIEPVDRLPEWHQPEVDHPQLRDPGLERVRAAGGRHPAPGLAGARLRRVLGVQPHSRTAARLRLLCTAAADLDAAHGRHPRRERPAGAVARLAAARGRARRPCHAGRRGRCQRRPEPHGRAPPGHARRLRRRASGGARRAPDGRGQRRLAERGRDRLRPVVSRSRCRASPPARRSAPTCSVATSFDAVVPGSAQERKRSIWALDQVEVFDGGNDGLAATTPNTLFAVQGVFVP